MPQKRRIILFGGTFDPIHNGHLIVAQHALHTLTAEQLIFVPARQSPHKQQPPSDGADRMAMIRCAIEGIDAMCVSDCELTRSGPSFTIDTIRFFRSQVDPKVDLHWLIGADQLGDLSKWYRIGELLQECHLSTMVRGGYPPPDMKCLEGDFTPEMIRRLETDIIPTPEVPISSTSIRRRLAEGVIPQDEVPACVAAYIKEHGLYGL